MTFFENIRKHDFHKFERQHFFKHFIYSGQPGQAGNVGPQGSPGPQVFILNIIFTLWKY